MEISIALAFFAGVVSFVTPCVLALVPVYLAILAESTVARPTGISGTGAAVALATPTRPALSSALLFVAGFSALFVVLGVAVGLLGTTLFRAEIVRQLTGVAVIAIGLVMTGLFGPIIDRLRRPSVEVALPANYAARSLALGALVAVGWTPCIGPVLGAILAMGASSQDVLVATILLVAYSAGLAVPFLAAALFLPRLGGLLRWLRSHERPIRIVSGLAVAGVGVLILLDAFTRMASLFGEFFL
jgi:cytochrome c-type biogenesis protein